MHSKINLEQNKVIWRIISMYTYISYLMIINTHSMQLNVTNKLTVFNNAFKLVISNCA